MLVQDFGESLTAADIPLLIHCLGAFARCPVLGMNVSFASIKQLWQLADVFNGFNAGGEKGDSSGKKEIGIDMNEELDEDGGSSPLVGE